MKMPPENYYKTIPPFDKNLFITSNEKNLLLPLTWVDPVELMNPSHCLGKQHGSGAAKPTANSADKTVNTVLIKVSK